MNAKNQSDWGYVRRMHQPYRVALVFGTMLVSLAALEGQVAAQTMTQQTPFVKRDPEATRTAPALIWDINRKECENDDKFTFGFNLAGWTTNPPDFKVYGTVNSVNCQDDTIRNMPTSQCFPMTVDKLPTPGAVSASITFTAKELMTYAGLSSCSDTSATYVNFDIFFMFVQGTNFVGTGVPWQMKTHIDLVGPGAPTEITVTSGEGSLDVSVKGTGDPNGQTRLYCAQNGAIVDNSPSMASSGSSGTGGMGGAAGSGGGSSSGGAGGAGGAGGGPTCPVAPLVAGQLPDVNWKECGTGSRIDNLQNGVTFAVAAAYTDNLGNTGPLSPIACGTPAPIDDFFEIYKQNGGAAGGGFCSISRTAQSMWSFGASFALGTLAFLWRRKSRASRCGTSQEVSK